MIKGKKILRNIMLFLILMVLTFYIILKDQDVSKIFILLANVNKRFILIAILCMCIYIICDAINIGRSLKALKEKSTFIKNIKYSLIGFFFSSITPAATGGQPMQVYYMYKDKITVANSTLSLLINLTCVQIVTISMAIVSLIFNYKYMNGILIAFFILGVTLNLSALTLLLISIFTKKMTNGIIKFIIRILKFFRVKNIEAKQEKLENELNKYQSSAIYIKNNIWLIFKNLITTYFQFVAFYSISYLVYKSFGLSEYNFFEILTMQSVLYATVSGIPSPGAVGVSEGGYMAIFSSICPGVLLDGAMLLTRGVSFYLFVAISAIVVILNATIKNRKTGDSRGEHE